MAILRFGTFEVRLTSSELYKQGRRVRLQQQPFEVLRTLLQNGGELVTREALRKALWPDGVTVDFDQSLNKSVTKLRDALGDPAASPCFIETLPKRGYRFIAPVTVVAPTAPLEPEPTAVTRTSPSRARVMIPVGLCVALFGGTGAFVATTHQSAGVEARAVRPAVRPTAATRSPIVAARDAYERGRLAQARRSEDGLKLSVEHFERAVALSPRYAEAYVGLADSWSLMSSYGLIDPREGMPRARDAANRALTLDPSLARAHASLGRTTMIFDWDWRTASWRFGKAVELEPGNSMTHQWFAYMLSATGRHAEAVEEARRALAAEPLSLNSQTALGYVLYLARRYDEAAVQLTRALEVDPDFAQARRDLALVRVQQGRYVEALAAFQRVAVLNESSPVAMAQQAWAHAVAGDSVTAQQMLAHLDRQRTVSYVPPDSLALVYAGLGVHDEAVAWLQRAFAVRASTLTHLPVDPVWDRLRDDARVREMIATIRAGLN